MFCKNLEEGLITSTIDAAIAAVEFAGLGDSIGADRAAVNSMRRALNKLDIKGIIVIGEGERDKAPMLYIGEQVGTTNGPEIDIAVDPLEGTNLLADNLNNSLSVIAAGPRGTILNAPDVYMEKIATCFSFKEQILDLDISISQNIKNYSLASNKKPEEIIAVVLDRPRHKELIAKIREQGVRVKLIADGDVSAIIETSYLGAYDLYIGTGGAPEGVLAAAAMKTLGGQICGRLIFSDDEERKRASSWNINDHKKKYYLNDLVSSDAIFVATGVTDGTLLSGAVLEDRIIFANSLVINSVDKSVKLINSHKLIT
ncbi:MAG: class II fructose-bisphosphatase [Rickettsiaceae bacterium]|nr:class II fructose-bisphosphatase [Rickettsiaceae bacterium]